MNAQKEVFKENLSLKDFADLFGTRTEKMPVRCQELIGNLDFHYRVLKEEERDSQILRVLKVIDSTLEVAGPHRNERWERGWSENLEEFIQSNYDFSKLVPKFVKQNEAIRLKGQYVMPRHPAFETSFVSVLRAWFSTVYFSNCESIYEFGCGPVHNLAALAKIFPEKTFYGLEWVQASLKIIKVLKENCGMNIIGKYFDMFRPDPEFKLRKDSGVLTIGALEQMGKQFEPFLDYLIRNKPTVCVHLETMEELYDPTRLFDYLALRYIRKRNYLSGFLTRLKQLENQNKIKIIQARRTFGSFFHDGYSCVVWKSL